MDDEDRDFFLRRLGGLVVETGNPVYAFALIPNHFHLLVRRDQTSIATLMRRLLTAYAMRFNKKYNRCGHLFQNRYKSVPCADEVYFLELLRYIHLNPVRAGVCSFDELAAYRFSGHGCLTGNMRIPWFSSATVLELFGQPARKAKFAYQEFIAAGLNQKEVGAQASVSQAENFSMDIKPADIKSACFIYEKRKHPVDLHHDVTRVIERTCMSCHVSKNELLGNGKARRISDARSHLARELSTRLGLTGAQIATLLGVQQATISKMLLRKRS